MNSDEIRNMSQRELTLFVLELEKKFKLMAENPLATREQLELKPRGINPLVFAYVFWWTLGMIVGAGMTLFITLNRPCL